MKKNVYDGKCSRIENQIIDSIFLKKTELTTEIITISVSDEAQYANGNEIDSKVCTKRRKISFPDKNAVLQINIISLPVTMNRKVKKQLVKSNFQQSQ